MAIIISVPHSLTPSQVEGAFRRGIEANAVVPRLHSKHS